MNKTLRDNKEKNREHYNKLYANYSISNILNTLENLDSFLIDAFSTETSWHALYQNDFKESLKGKKVMEMGCGDCVNAAVMAGLGAEVYANDIAEASGQIIEKLNQAWDFKYPIQFIEGDFLKNNLEAGEFDFVVGKAFLHHLTLSEEREFLKETARLLTPEGEARFFEPAVNNRILDILRWYIPVPGRPSKFNNIAFAKWKENDPHPDRSFSSKHWKNAGGEFFCEVNVMPLGALERFSRVLKNKERKWKYRKWAFKAEKTIPHSINYSFARSQLITYKSPLNRN